MGRLFLAEEITKKEICTSLHHPHRKKRQRANLRYGTSMHKTAKAKLFVMQRTVFIIHNMMNQSSTKIIAAAPILALLVQFAPMSLRAGADAPDGELRLDRYTLQPQNPTAEQLDLLATAVETQFPESIATVGAAIDYLLERSGYRRIPTESTAAGMSLPLPKVHQHIGPLKLRDALQTIAGPALKLRENVETRVVWFAKTTSSEIPKDSVPPLAEPVPPAPTGMVATAPTQPASTLPAELRDWRLIAGTSLRENLDAWATAVGWTLEWATAHDYRITHGVDFRSTFKDAVIKALEFYRTAPVALTATFYGGNSVLVVSPLLARRLQ